jgi:hypothetical protein
MIMGVWVRNVIGYVCWVLGVWLRFLIGYVCRVLALRLLTRRHIRSPVFNGHPLLFPTDSFEFHHVETR